MSSPENNNPSDGNSSPSNNNSDNGGSSIGPRLQAFSFSGRVVFGVGLIVFAAAASTIYATTWSQSPQIHTSLTNMSGSNVMATGSSSSILQPTAAQPSSSKSSGSSASAEHIDKKFLLVQGDFTWNHTSPGPAIKVNKGDKVQITVVNAGSMAHNFGMGQPSEKAKNLMMKIKDLPLTERVSTIPYNDLAQMPCPDCHAKFKEGHIEHYMKPETQAITTFTANEAGHFKYFCMVRGHIWLGMIGDLIVQDNNNSTGSSGGGESSSNSTQASSNAGGSA